MIYGRIDGKIISQKGAHIMDSNVEVIKNNEYESSSWPGGTTTQLLIYPKDANYVDRNFKWRISSAKVEAEESVFTHLPGISRIIMAIDGVLILSHEGKYNVTLRPFDQDSFMGDWTTKSFGKATDFNLMLNEGCSGELNALSIKRLSVLNMMLKSGNGNYENVTNVFFAVNGDLELLIYDMMFNIREGDLIYITQLKKEENLEIRLSNKLDKEIKVIQALIYY